MRAESWIRRFRYIPKRRLCYTSCSCECAPIPVSIEKLRYFKSCAPACMNLDAKLDSGMLTSYQIRPNGDRKPVLRFLSQEVVENWLKENTASAWARLGESRGMERTCMSAPRLIQSIHDSINLRPFSSPSMAQNRYNLQIMLTTQRQFNDYVFNVVLYPCSRAHRDCKMCETFRCSAWSFSRTPLRHFYNALKRGGHAWRPQVLIFEDRW